MRIYFIFFFFIASFFLVPGSVFAAPCTPPNCPAGLTQLEEVFTGIISSAVYLAFIALFVMLLFAGIKYMTSGGDQKAIAAAHQATTWAIMGILLLALSWIALQLVAAFTGIDALKSFNVRTLL